MSDLFSVAMSKLNEINKQFTECGRVTRKAKREAVAALKALSRETKARLRTKKKFLAAVGRRELGGSLKCALREHRRPTQRKSCCLFLPQTGTREDAGFARPKCKELARFTAQRLSASGRSTGYFERTVKRPPR